MDSQIRLLLDILEAQQPAPDDVPAFLEALPDVGTLPSPWETWTLIGLVRHRKRQYWVRDIIHNRLRGDSAALGAMGALGHPDGVEQSGTVPGMPEWEYYFHGGGCCLTHKVTGEDIDVDFWDDSAEHFDMFFYTNYLKSLRNPEPPEQRLLELHRSVRPVRIAATRLLAAGAMTPRSSRDSHPLRIADGVLASEAAIAAFCRAWGDPARRVWLAGMIGDWPAAHEAAAGRHTIEQITAPRAERCRAIRRDYLLKETDQAASDALEGLAELGGADEQLKEALRGPPSGTVSTALGIAERQNDPKWYPHIYSVFKRMRPTGQLPEPHIWVTSLGILLRHGYRKEEMIASLTMAGGSVVGEGALLALEHAPEHALALIRQALLADTPCNRTTAAAILALIARPWSMRELFRALDASDDQQKTADARAALLETGDPEAEKAVAWEERNPHEVEPDKHIEVGGRRIRVYSMDEVVLNSTGTFVRHEMDELHDRVMKIKDVIPPEPAAQKPWWKFWGSLSPRRNESPS